MSTSSDDISFPVQDSESSKADSPPLPRPFLQGQARLLKRLSKGAGSTSLLDELVRLVEEVLDDVVGLVLRYRDDTDVLTVAAALHLPSGYQTALNGVSPGPQAGSSGKAVWSEAPVIAEDINQADCWATYREQALAHGLRACWAVPVQASDETVLGALAFYRSAPASPSPLESHLLSEASHLASVVLERAQRKQTLRETRQRHREFLEVLPVGVYRTTPEGELLYANPALVDMLGAQSVAALGQINMRNRYVDQDAREVFKADVAETGIIEQCEARIRRLDGATTDVLESARAVRNDEGEVEYYEGIFQEITEWKKSQRGPHDREEQLRAILENAQPVFFMIDRNGVFLLAEGKGLEALDLSTEEVVGTSVHDLFGDYPEFLDQVDAALDGETVSFATEVRGRLLDTWCTPYVNEAGRMTACIGMSTDITERREAHVELRETKNFYEQLLDQLPMELAVFDPDARFEYVNAQGVSDPDTREWLIGRTNEEYFRHRDLDVELGQERDEAIREVARTSEPTRVQESIETDDGTRHYVRIHVPVTDLQGRVTNVVGCSLEITEQIRSEEELRKAKEAAEEAAQLKSAMLANMSHEVRTPLTSITGFAKVLEEEGTEADVEKFSELIAKSGRRLLNTLDSVLQLSKLEAGGRSLDRQRVDLTEEARTIVTEQRARPEAEEINISTETASRPVYGDCDPTAVQRIMTNLVGNAIKFTGPGDDVTVRVYRKDDHACLEVEDTGVGIADSFQDEMFEAFKQESSGLAREYEGSGLGLSLVKELVDRHNGTLDVDSAPGSGTTITVRLPLYED